MICTRPQGTFEKLQWPELSAITVDCRFRPFSVTWARGIGSLVVEFIVLPSTAQSVLTGACCWADATAVNARNARIARINLIPEIPKLNVYGLVRRYLLRKAQFIIAAPV